MRNRWAALAVVVLPGCLYVVRGGPTLWTHPDRATVVGARANVGAGVGDHEVGFDMHVGLGAGADVATGDGSLSGTIGLEYLRPPEPVGLRLGAEADIRTVFHDTTRGDVGWVVPQLVGGTSYLLGEGSSWAIGLEATLGYAIPLNTWSYAGVAMGISVTLEWTRINAFVPHARGSAGRRRIGAP